MPNLQMLDDLIRRLSDSATPVTPSPNRWFAGKEGPQQLVEKVVSRTGRPRADFQHGAYVDPRTGEVLDFNIYSSGVATGFDPSSGRPRMLVSGGTPVAADGPLVDTNLVRRSVGWEPDSAELDLPFLATAETGGRHHYGVGIDYSSPVLLRRIDRGSNPHLRPRARGSVYGDNLLGSIDYNGRVHPVYEMLRIASRNPSLSAADVGSSTDLGTLLRYGVLAPLLQDGLNQPQQAESKAPAF